MNREARIVTDEGTEDWRRHAACRGCDVELFFPVGVTGPAVEQIEAAKVICGECPVRVECLEFALLTNQGAGVWGGATEEERRKLRRTWLARRRALQVPGPRTSW